ncbi:hypothetical protein SH661x_003594 [Planctomicrobium sp. SH661]|uniref:hypothetical protein n=1 Tax=Planctomicrobium sp. SH661 TaxID=3448124 RepID=UPI003F5C6115
MLKQVVCWAVWIVCFCYPLCLRASDSDIGVIPEPQIDFDNGPVHTLFPFLTLTPSGRALPEPSGAEDRRSHNITPLIPEPMIFDLVRPLGEHRGAAEVNILSLFPLGGRRTLEYVDPLGIVHVSEDRGHIEWAPEYEVAIRDGLAIEFEFPFESGTLEALKTAVQWTIGTALEEHYIHGVQVIVEPTVDFQNWNLVALYLGGYRFNETWSTLMMIGGRAVTGPNVRHDEREFLFNYSVFANVSDHITTGLEGNFAQSNDGHTALLLTPQVHVEITDHFLIQTGVPVGFESSGVSPFWSVRGIYSF